MTAAPLLYHIRGRRPHMYPQSIAAAELLFGRKIEDTLIGMFLRVCPDGLVIACNNGKWYETDRQRLKEITADDPGLIVETKGEPQPPLDPVEFWRDVIREVRERTR